MMRILWPALMLALAAMAIAAQLDRQSRIAQSFAETVPSPFRGFAQEDIVRRLLAERDSAAALVAARELIASRPVPAEHLSMLAQAQLLAGENESALILAQRAAHRSWRDESTQLLMFQLAVSSGEDVEMSRRLAALWAIQADRELLSEITPLVLSRAEARAEFVAILSTKPRWKRQFDIYAERNLPAAEGDILRDEIGAAASD